MILRYFASAQVNELPLTDICSKYFWKTEPTAYHDFDTITAINDDAGDTRPNTLDPDSESEDEIQTDRPLTEQQFNSSTYWFTFRQIEHQAKACVICLLDFNENNRISFLACHHNYHQECVKTWLTTRSSSCPNRCLESSRANELTNAQLAPTNPRVVSPTPPVHSLTVRPTTGLRLRTAHESDDDMDSTRTSSSSSDNRQDDNSSHTFLSIFEGQTDFSKRNLIKLANKYDYIIIDEIGLMNRELYDMFYYMKINSDVKFILSGDSAQLKPIQSKGIKL